MSDHPSFGFGHFVAQLDTIGMGVFALLLIMSVMSWYLIVVKALRTLQMRRASRAFLLRNRDEGTGFVGDDVGGADSDSPPSRLTAKALEAARQWRESSVRGAIRSDRQDELLARAIRSALSRETAAMESGLAPLASVASTAPFVGLFGTVWAIYHALTAIGFSGKAGLEAVAGPVGEALIMTALGLAVAIPASLAYNGFARSNRLFLAELDDYAQGLHSSLLMGTRPLHAVAADAIAARAAAAGAP